MSSAAKRGKLQAMILLPLEMRKVARDNTIIASLKLGHESSDEACSTDNPSH